MSKVWNKLLCDLGQRNRMRLRFRKHIVPYIVWMLYIIYYSIATINDITCDDDGDICWCKTLLLGCHGHMWVCHAWHEIQRVVLEYFTICIGFRLSEYVVSFWYAAGVFRYVWHIQTCGCRFPRYFIVPGHRKSLFREWLNEKRVKWLIFRHPPYLHVTFTLSRRRRFVMSVTVDTQDVSWLQSTKMALVDILVFNIYHWYPILCLLIPIWQPIYVIDVYVYEWYEGSQSDRFETAGECFCLAFVQLFSYIVVNQKFRISVSLYFPVYQILTFLTGTMTLSRHRA